MEFLSMRLQQELYQSHKNYQKLDVFRFLDEDDQADADLLDMSGRINGVLTYHRLQGKKIILI